MTRLTITFLGGLGDIGRNCAVLEHDGKALLIDCGMMFPTTDMPGVDLVLPDFDYLRSMPASLLGCVITHGHEDHSGGLPHLLREFPVPLIGSSLALHLASRRIDEAGLAHQDIVVGDYERLQVGPFDLEFVPVCHSVPHGFATVIRVGGRVVLHTGDWKIDHDPADQRKTDLARLATIAQTEGVDLLLGDSTNANEPGYSASERTVKENLLGLFRANEDSRIICTCFASHIHRIQAIASVAVESGRRIATLGLSMKRNLEIAQDLGLITLPPSKVVDIADVKELPPSEVCIISTGSQGEPMSALGLASRGRSRWLTIGQDDVVIMSSWPIPGNEVNVGEMIDSLARRGARVFLGGPTGTHATGHAQEGEIRTLLELVRPSAIVPVHGEFLHMRAHANIALAAGVNPSNVLLCEDGDRVELEGQSPRLVKGVASSRYVYVDGGQLPLDKKTLRDRSQLSQSGIVAVSARVTFGTEPRIDVQVSSRGWLRQSDLHLEDECRTQVTEHLRRSAPSTSDYKALLTLVERTVLGFAAERTRRKPMVVTQLSLEGGRNDLG